MSGKGAEWRKLLIRRYMQDFRLLSPTCKMPGKNRAGAFTRGIFRGRRPLAWRKSSQDFCNGRFRKIAAAADANSSRVTGILSSRGKPFAM